jgi:hypothetical protein
VKKEELVVEWCLWLELYSLPLSKDSTSVGLERVNINKLPIIWHDFENSELNIKITDSASQRYKLLVYSKHHTLSSNNRILH